MKYKRILLKLSGEALMGDGEYGISPDKIAEYARDIQTIVLHFPARTKAPFVMC